MYRCTEDAMMNPIRKHDQPEKDELLIRNFELILWAGNQLNKRVLCASLQKHRTSTLIFCFLALQNIHQITREPNQNIINYI